MNRKPLETAPARMDSLARLPVFMDLNGQRVVVAGGTDGAAWKAELLLAAGAHVDLYATELEPDMATLLADHPTGARLVHRCRDWLPRDLAGAAFVIADAECDEEARIFAEAAKQAGVPYNVIDRPNFCQVQFGSIVNRSPVVIGISTAGAAPILGQTVRRKIETLLPASLKDWAWAAQRVRSAVMDRLPAGPKRRAFWERFAELSFTASGKDAQVFNPDKILSKASNEAASGKVTLVGAGPGDPDLLTMKAIRALQAADIILFDDLVSNEVLELARREARRMMVGKRGGKSSCKQDDINALMIKLAGQGKHVVRLKSGDPMVFGRAGEEIAALRERGIPVSVVPGITAASALASATCASLTHRDCAQSVSLVTGHSKRGVLPETLDLDAMAKGHSSQIVYMGSRTAGDLAQALMERGAAAELPVLVAQSVSRPNQAIHKTNLCQMAEVVEGLAADGPVLIAIGNAFKAAQVSSSTDLMPPSGAFGTFGTVEPQQRRALA
ncbi:MAG: siroheme synthase CysG [Pseudomonadota bacterium]